MPESNTTPPKRYFAWHYLILRFLGLGWWHHPDENNTQNFSGLYIYYVVFTEIFCVATFISLETIDPFIGEKDIDRFMFSISFVATHNLTLIKMCIFFFKNKEIQHVVKTLDVDLKEFYQNNDNNRRTVKITKMLTSSFLFFGWMTILNTNVYGLIQDMHWKAEIALWNSSDPMPGRILPQPIYIPWEHETTTSYILTYIFETVGLLWTGHIVITLDTFIASVILHMSSQYIILQEH